MLLVVSMALIFGHLGRRLSGTSVIWDSTVDGVSGSRRTYTNNHKCRAAALAARHKFIFSIKILKSVQ